MLPLRKQEYHPRLSFIVPMKRKEISEPERLSRFVSSFGSHSQDFKGLTLELVASGQSIEAVSTLTGVSPSTLYEWIEHWNEKKKLA
jgi:transposase-like protein